MNSDADALEVADILNTLYVPKDASASPKSVEHSQLKVLNNKSPASTVVRLTSHELSAPRSRKRSASASGDDAFSDASSVGSLDLSATEQVMKKRRTT